ncbi:hypothetical protein PI126_g3993 [Phytophthora idaei]|nr:hypothetical protein PI126_g3993 [Phytophthora idaei]
MSVKAMPPCFQCSATGYNRSRCHNADDQWKMNQYCLQVTVEEIASLHRNPSTIANPEEIDLMWIDDTEIRLRPKASFSGFKDGNQSPSPTATNHDNVHISPRTEYSEWKMTGSQLPSLQRGFETQSAESTGDSGTIRPRSILRWEAVPQESALDNVATAPPPKHKEKK